MSSTSTSQRSFSARIPPQFDCTLFDVEEPLIRNVRRQSPQPASPELTTPQLSAAAGTVCCGAVWSLVAGLLLLAVAARVFLAAARRLAESANGLASRTLEHHPSSDSAVSIPQKRHWPATTR